MESYLSEAEGAEVRDEFFKLFLTGKEMGTVVDLVLVRDIDGVLTNIYYDDVKLTIAARQAETVDVNAAFVITTQGQFAREIPFDPLVGDTFTVLEKNGRVLVVYPEMNRVVRCDIEFQNPYG